MKVLQFVMIVFSKKISPLLICYRLLVGHHLIFSRFRLRFCIGFLSDHFFMRLSTHLSVNPFSLIKFFSLLLGLLFSPSIGFDIQHYKVTPAAFGTID